MGTLFYERSTVHCIDTDTLKLAAKYIIIIIIIDTLPFLLSFFHV